MLVDGAARKAGYKFKGGEKISVALPQRVERAIEAEDIPLDIVYEDERIAVVNKAAGMVTHPAPGHESGTLANALLWRYPELAAMLDDPATKDRLGIAHRLDRGTSGLLLAAREKSALLNLMRQFQARRVDKVYPGVAGETPGLPTPGIIDAPIARDPRQRKRMAVRRDGKRRAPSLKCSITTFKTTARLSNYGC